MLNKKPPMSFHTPGPWELQDLQPAIEAGNIKPGPDGTRFRIFGTTTLWLDVVSFSDGFVYGQNEANAKLICAAPDLLKALEAMLTHMGMDEDEWTKPTFDQARAAIKKALT